MNYKEFNKVIADWSQAIDEAKARSKQEYLSMFGKPLPWEGKIVDIQSREELIATRHYPNIIRYEGQILKYYKAYLGSVSYMNFIEEIRKLGLDEVFMGASSDACGAHVTCYIPDGFDPDNIYR